MIYPDEAEHVVLGSMFGPGRSLAHIAACLNHLDEDDFTGDHKAIFRAIEEAFEKGLDLNQPGTIRRLCPGIDPLYVLELMDTPGSEREAFRHIDLLKEQRRRREWGAIVAQAPASDRDLQSLATKAYMLTQDVPADPTHDMAKTVGDRLLAYEKTPDLSTSLPSGLATFDEDFGGIYPGRTYVIGAKTSYGKTALMTQASVEVVKAGGKVLFFSLEMTAQEIAERVIAMTTDVNPSKLRNPSSLTQEEWDALVLGGSKLESNHFLLAEGWRNATLEQAMKRVRFAATILKGLDLIVVDYIQLLSLGRRSENRNLELSEISRAFKVMAQEMQVAVMIGSQLRRNSDKRKDTEPTLDDLRDSGSLEQDANMVVLIHRPKEDNSDIRLADSIPTDLLIAKNRNGRTGRISCRFIPSQGRFE